ncbi:MAG: hypothetical protein NBV67_18820 [Tagaea sp.]|nr:hypothetical protein [Tagaea sp.]
MTDKNHFRLHPNFQARLREVIVAAEGPAKTSIPRSGDSGISTGPMQLDLSKQHGFRAAVIAAGQQTGSSDRTEARRQESDRLLRSTNKSVPAAQYDAVDARARQLVDEILSTPAGREALQAAEREQLARVERTVQRVCGQAGANARAFCGSAQGQLELAAHLHQYGPKTEKLEAFLRGEQITLDGGTDGRNNRTRMEGPLTVEQFRERFRNQTQWARESASGNDGRHRNLDRYFRQQNIEDGSRARINPGQRSEAAPDEQAPSQTPSQVHASLAPEQMREQSANIAAASGQPLVQRTSWTPDPAKIGEAIASVHADDLPAWTQNLLGRDVLTNDAKPAVMGFQRAINAATKPPRFDYRWGLGGRQGRIEVDGDLGPQTRAGFGRAIEKQGEDGFKKLYALDQFGRYVTNVDRGRAKLDDLEDTIGGTLGQAIPDAPERAQETLNMLAEDREEPGSPLKIDGWVGPKTTEAFGTLLRKTSPNALTARFAGNDFWEDEDLA